MEGYVEPLITRSLASSAGHTGTGNLWFVTLISLISAMGGFLFGYETVVIAGTIAPVKAQFGFSAFMEGWFVSSGLAGCVVGVVVAGSLCDRLGRKSVMLLCGALLTIAAMACAFAPSVAWLITGRGIGGVGVGLASIVSPLYISEVAPAQFRGRLVSLFQVTITIGIVAAMLINARLLSHSLGSPSGPNEGTWHWLFIEQVWRGMFLGQTVPALIFLVCALVVPESPRWLVLRGRLKRAKGVLLELRGEESQSEHELGQIRDALAREGGPSRNWREAELTQPLFLGIFLAVFSELSGITVVMYYGPIILERAGASANSALGGHAIVGIVLALFTLLGVPLVDRLGRRKVLLSGVAGACLALTAAGICFAAGVTDGMVVLMLLCAFVAFFAFSLGPIKWVVISEIFPTSSRARAMSVATVALWLTDIVVNQSFPIVRDTFGIAVMFLACAVFLAIQFFVVWRKLPETRGMALEDIVRLWKLPGRN